jgi:hypothetical protein
VALTEPDTFVDRLGGKLKFSAAAKAEFSTSAGEDAALVVPGTGEQGMPPSGRLASLKVSASGSGHGEIRYLVRHS